MSGPSSFGDRSPAVAVNHGTIHTGDHVAKQVVLPGDLKSASSVDCPERLCNVPVLPKSFIGRSTQLARLAGAWHPSARVVTGLGGVGKSFLAAKWAYDQAGEHIPAWWMDASSSDAVTLGLAGLAIAIEPHLEAVLTQEALAERAIQWLASHSGWLVVLDNVRSVEDVRGLLARVTTGKFLITSRRATGWEGLADSLTLDSFTPEESYGLFASKVHALGPHFTDGAEALCDELGHLPLAIEQAGAFCAESQTTPSEYLGFLAEYPADAYKAAAEDSAEERAIARIWHVSLNRLAIVAPAAGSLLRTLAWYAPTGVPREFLPDDLPNRQGLGKLAAHSMITLSVPPGQIAVHPLVQSVSRTPDLEDPHRQPGDIDEACHRAIVGIVTSLPEQDAQTERAAWFRIAPHVAAYYRNAPTDKDSVWVARALNDIAVFLNYEGLHAESVRYLERALDFHQRRGMSPANPDGQSIRGNLAIAYGNTGFASVAVPMARGALNDVVASLGEDHPASLNALNNLAGALYRDGEVSDAIMLYEQSLQLHVAKFGEVHRETLIARNNLAVAYKRRGRLREATFMLKENLDHRTQILGEEHPHTLLTRANLAQAYEEEGRLVDALRCFTENAEASEQALGDTHPMVLQSREGVARVRFKSGEPMKAAMLLEGILSARLQLHGDRDPQTLECRNLLGKAWLAMGLAPAGIALLEENFAIKIEVFGDNAPTTLLAGNNLGHALSQAGFEDQAVRVLEDNLARREQVLGQTHPDTLVSVRNLAVSAAKAGDLARAVKYAGVDLKWREQVLGPDHPDTLISRDNLAFALHNAGQFDEVPPLLHTNLEYRHARYGPSHAETLKAQKTLQVALEQYQ
jgi:tetratricopeptide (TPR) repeat protein